MERVAIFGATSAIASEVARAYAARGAQLLLVARNGEKLAALHSELGAQVVGQISADFTTCDGDALVAEVARQLGKIDVAVIAHGELGDQLQSEASYPEAEHIVQVNFLSVLRLVIPLANLMEAEGRGHLAVMSSVAGERGRPRNYTYGAAKGALTTYLQGVRSRLWPNVSVHTLKLGPVHSPMTENHKKNALFAEPKAVAVDVLRTIDNDVAEAFVPWFWRPIMQTVEYLPEALFQRLKFLSGR